MWRSGRTSTPGGVQVDEEVGDALALGHVGVGAGQADAEVGHVGPGGPHLLAGEHPLVAVALGPGGERGRSDPAPGSLKSWHHTLLVAHDRRQEAQPLLLGAVGEQRGRGQVEPERVEPAEVVRAPARPRSARATAGRHVEPAVRRPARWARRAPTPRTSGTRPRSRPGCAPRGWRPRRPARRGLPPRRPARASATHAARRRRRPRRRRRAAVDGEIGGTSPAREVGVALLLEGGEALAEVLARDDSSRAKASSAGGRRAAASRRCAAATWSARGTRWARPPAAAASASAVASTSAAGTARWTSPQSTASAPVSRRPSSSSSRARGQADPPGQQPGAAAVGGEAPLANGSQSVASSAATVKSAAARGGGRCRRPSPGRGTRPAPARCSTSGIRRWASDGTRRWIVPTRGRSPSPGGVAGRRCRRRCRSGRRRRRAGSPAPPRRARRRRSRR